MKRKRPPTIKARIDRVIPGLGRKLVRTGARTLAEHRARIALFDRVLEIGQLDAVYALLRGDISWEELRQAQRKNQLHSDLLASNMKLSRPLWKAVEDTVLTMGKVASSRARYTLAFDHLEEYAVDFLPANAQVRALKDVAWPDVFGAMASLSPASRNRVRSAVSAFLTKFLGDKFHPFRREVMKAIGGMEKENTPPKEITVGEFWKNLAATPEFARASIVTLAGTGLRVGEFLQCDEFSARRLPVIWFPGGKTGADETVIDETLLPFARQAIPCTFAPRPSEFRGVQYDARYKRLYKAMRTASDATGVDWSPHYLRHLYAKLGTDQLSAALVQQGLRHATPAMTAQYAKRKTTAQVANVVAGALLEGRKKERQKGRPKVRSKVRGESRRVS